MRNEENLPLDLLYKEAGRKSFSDMGIERLREDDLVVGLNMTPLEVF